LIELVQGSMIGGELGTWISRLNLCPERGEPLNGNLFVKQIT
jgi:hypothetical protein